MSRSLSKRAMNVHDGKMVIFLKLRQVNPLQLMNFFKYQATDFIGPLPTTKDGNKYILTFVDHFTRYCFAIPLPEQTTERVAYELVHRIILQHGTPKNLLSDQGTQFLSKVLQETCRLMKIKKFQTTAFHPQSNGICEIFYRTLLNMMYFVSKEAQNWDKCLPYAVLA